MTFKNETLNWDDLRLFSAVVQNGGLVGAVSMTGVSAPTLSRRMRTLEDKLGLHLFDRKSAGYELTSHGRDLQSRVQEMEEQAKSIQSWRSQLDQRPVVRVTAGMWTSVFLARYMGAHTADPVWPRIELLTGSRFLNLSRREADIAVRNKRPEQQGLKRKRIGQVTFAVYGTHSYCDMHAEALTEDRYANCDWVIPSVSGGTGTSSFWIKQRIGGRARLTCDTPHAMLEAVASGVGLCVLPKFIGSTDSRLQACSDSIEDLSHTQWLVAHQDGGELTHIRKVFRGICDLFEQHQTVFR